MIPARERIDAAKAKLLLSSPWFATLLLHLRVVETERVPMMGVDGTNLFYNPAFVDGLTGDELRVVLVAFVAHVVCPLTRIRASKIDLERVAPTAKRLAPGIVLALLAAPGQPVHQEGGTKRGIGSAFSTSSRYPGIFAGTPYATWWALNSSEIR